MNVKGLFLFLVLVGLGTGCTNDEGLDGTSSAAGGSNEIQLMFGRSGDGVDYTKAIATVDENEMNALDVYVFASTEKEGTYYYLETWKKRDTAPAAGDKGFMLQTSGSGKMASIKPAEIAGLPYLKLYCVANSEAFGQDGTTATKLSLTPVTAYNRETGVTTPASPTTSDVFEAAFTQKLGGDDGLGLKEMTCPLPMSGVGETKISGSVSKVDIEMTRAVARFDIDNDQATSRLTITYVSVLNGRKNAPLFKTGVLPTVTTPEQKTAELMNYGDKDFSALPGANRGETAGALYVYPGAATDGSLLLVKGTYLNSSGNEVPVSYKVEITMQGEAVGINRNSRYKLHIGNATESQISGAFEVEDWVSNGGAELKPDNARPTFLNNNILDAIEVVEPQLGAKPLQDKTNPLALRLNEDKGSFKLNAYASSKVEAEIEELTKAAAWLTVSGMETKDDAENPGRKITTLTFSYDKAIGAVPLTVTLRNSAASYDPALWTVFTLNGPFKAPVITPLENQTGFTPGNTVTQNPDTKVITATMYTANESFVQLNMASADGVKIEAPDWLSVTATPGVKAAGAVTYTIKIVGEVPAGTNSATVKFINAADDTATPATTEITITLESAALSVEEGTDTNEAASFATEGAVTTVTVDLDKLSDGNFIFKVTAPQGVTAPDFSGCTWLTVNETAWSKENGYAEYTVSATSGASAFESYTAEFINTIPNGGNVTVKFDKATDTPVVTSNASGNYADSPFNPFITSSKE